MTIYILGTLTIILPLFLITWHAFTRIQSKSEWLLKSLLIAGIILIFYKIGLWTLSSYYLRFIIVALLVGSSLYSFLKIRSIPWRADENQWFRLGGISFFALLSLISSALTFSGCFYSASNTVSLQFPFEQGTYCVIQGGSKLITNPFHRMSLHAKYAIDIVEINNLGNRATRVFPDNLSQYHIFDNVVISPCNGRVVTVVSDLQDNMPPIVDPQHSAGNHIIIDCNNTRVMLAHLKEGSLKASAGDDIQQGQPIGEVGNSGYTDEPHLHIQANRLDGNPVQIAFSARLLSINDLYAVK